MSDVGDELSAAYVEVFDAKRDIFGPEDDLLLIKFVPATGYTTVETISAGWFSKLVTDPTTGGEFFEVKIAENGSDLAPTFRGKISHVQFGGYRYKVSGVEQPKQAIKVWIVRCASTGERSP